MPATHSCCARLAYLTRNSAWFQAGQPPAPSATRMRPARSALSSAWQRKVKIHLHAVLRAQA
jgi:hypothetical protein